jgi:hypothetical protein
MSVKQRRIKMGYFTMLAGHRLSYGHADYRYAVGSGGSSGGSGRQKIAASIEYNKEEK